MTTRSGIGDAPKRREDLRFLTGQGRYLDDLKPEDFHVLEDGHEQKVSFFSHDRRVPISVGVLIDNSGSMRHKLQQALQTIREIATALGGGIDYRLIHGIAWRLQGDEVHTRFFGGGQDHFRFSTGIDFRF